MSNALHFESPSPEQAMNSGPRKDSPARHGFVEETPSDAEMAGRADAPDRGARGNFDDALGESAADAAGSDPGATASLRKPHMGQEENGVEGAPQDIGPVDGWRRPANTATGSEEWRADSATQHTPDRGDASAGTRAGLNPGDWWGRSSDAAGHASNIGLEFREDQGLPMTGPGFSAENHALAWQRVEHAMAGLMETDESDWAETGGAGSPYSPWTIGTHADASSHGGGPFVHGSGQTRVGAVEPSSDGSLRQYHGLPA